MIHRETIFEAAVDGVVKKLTLTVGNSNRGMLLFKEVGSEYYYWLYPESVEPQPKIADCDVLDYQVEQYLHQFAAYLNERCDLNVTNMVRPFMEGE